MGFCPTGLLTCMYFLAPLVLVCVDVGHELTGALGGGKSEV